MPRFLPTALLVTALGLAVLAPPAQAASDRTGSGAAAALAGSTTENLLAAMHGEAFARGSYLAYADQAKAVRNPSVAALFTRIAKAELDKHFTTEADLVGLVGSDDANLRAAIAGESSEATTMYPQFEAEAKAQGDEAAAALFHEIAIDEADHRARFEQALAALSGDGTTPAPPTVTPVAIPAGPALSQGATLANLKSALHGEAFASATYLAYAAQARANGHQELALLFTRISEVELREHFAGEAVLAGLVGQTGANLTTAATGENEEATSMYPQYAAEAEAAGDHEVATEFLKIAKDEGNHRDAFLRAGGRL